MELVTKRCPRCGESKALAEFTRDRAKKSGYHAYCKTCNYLRLKEKLGSEYYRNYRKEWELSHRYGMSTAEFDVRAKSQDGRCAICSKVVDRLVVDHDHSTGKVRALLCISCNGLLGLAGDSKDVLEAAIRYLQMFEHADVRVGHIESISGSGTGASRTVEPN